MSETKRNIPLFEEFSADPQKYLSEAEDTRTPLEKVEDYLATTASDGATAADVAIVAGVSEEEAAELMKQVNENASEEGKTEDDKIDNEGKKDEDSASVNENDEAAQPSVDDVTQPSTEENAGPEMKDHVPSFDEYVEEIHQDKEGPVQDLETEDDILGAEVQQPAEGTQEPEASQDADTPPAESYCTLQW